MGEEPGKVLSRVAEGVAHGLLPGIGYMELYGN